MAQQLSVGAARLPAFKLSVFRTLVHIWSGGSRWGLQCPSSEGEVAPASSFSDPQPRGGWGAAEGQEAGALAFALQRQGNQQKVTITCLLWGQNIPRSNMMILGKSSLPQVLVSSGGQGRRKCLVICAAQALAAGGWVVRTQRPPGGPGLGRLARFPGPGPLPS